MIRNVSTSLLLVCLLASCVLSQTVDYGELIQVEVPAAENALAGSRAYLEYSERLRVFRTQILLLEEQKTTGAERRERMVELYEETLSDQDDAEQAAAFMPPTLSREDETSLRKFALEEQVSNHSELVVHLTYNLFRHRAETVEESEESWLYLPTWKTWEVPAWDEAVLEPGGDEAAYREAAARLDERIAAASDLLRDLHIPESPEQSYWSRYTYLVDFLANECWVPECADPDEFEASEHQQRQAMRTIMYVPPLVYQHELDALREKLSDNPSFGRVELEVETLFRPRLVGMSEYEPYDLDEDMLYRFSDR